MDKIVLLRPGQFPETINALPGGLVYPFKDMQIGDELYIVGEPEKLASAGRSATQYAKRNGVRFRRKTYKDLGVAITRIA